MEMDKKRQDIQKGFRLKEGESICDKCKGTKVEYFARIEEYIHCKKCKGAGKLDWIESICGKRYVPTDFTKLKMLKQQTVIDCGIPKKFLTNEEVKNGDK